MLKCYGENSFTFLLFSELQRSSGIITPLIANLKTFAGGCTFEKKNPAKYAEMAGGDEPEVWLFPNFGRRSGFGEPDAIVLCGDYSFWFEVETNFNLKKRKTAARNSLNQLMRFHYFAQALKEGKTRRSKGKSHWAIMGPTINGKREFKDAILRCADHAVLKKIGERLAQSVEKEQDHYVLFSERKMKDISRKEKGRSKIHRLFDEVADESHHLIKEGCEGQSLPAKPNVKRFWYQSYENDLNRYVEINNESIKYVRISTG